MCAPAAQSQDWVIWEGFLEEVLLPGVGRVMLSLLPLFTSLTLLFSLSPDHGA